MRVIIAPDSFKESLSALEVSNAIKDGWSQVMPDTNFDLVPISDGGEGMMSTLMAAQGGILDVVEVPNPLWLEEKILSDKADQTQNSTIALPVSTHTTICNTLQAKLAWIPNRKLVVIESAEAIGLDLVPCELRNPLYTSSYGLGLMIRYAYKNYVISGKADTLLIGIGGSSTVDCGVGMAQALGAKFFDATGTEVGRGGRVLANIHRVDVSDMVDVSACTVIVASDVQNPLYGEQGAAKVFGPQKGATAEIVEVLEQGIQHLATILARDLSLDTQTQINFSCAGAAGGLGTACSIFCNAKIQSGINIMIEYLGLSNLIPHADLIITGEGKVDGQSLQGKVVFGVLQAANQHGVPVCVIAGALDNGYEVLYDYGVAALFSATPISSNWKTIQSNAYKNLVLTAKAVASTYFLCKRSSPQFS